MLLFYFNRAMLESATATWTHTQQSRRHPLVGAHATGRFFPLSLQRMPHLQIRAVHGTLQSSFCAEADVPNVPVSISCTSSAPVVLVLAAAPSSSSDRLFEKLQTQSHFQLESSSKITHTEGLVFLSLATRKMCLAMEKVKGQP